MLKSTTLSKIKKGEHFRFPGKTKVYLYTGRYAKAYTYTSVDDISSGYRTKTDRTVEIGFTF